MAAVLLATTMVFFGIGYRLVSIQGFSADHYLKVGLDQRLTKVQLAGQRGTIFDRQGAELAVSVPQTTIWADPQLVTDPEREAEQLAPVLGLPVATVQSQLSTAGQFVYIAHTVPDAQASAVKRLKLKGIFAMQEPKRFEPSAPLAAPLLGAVGAGDHGLSGLEAEYNAKLSGRAGTLIQETDPDGTPIPGGFRQYQPSVNGTDLVLTIDAGLQAQAEQALSSAIVAAKAKSGMAAVMDTQTGELLAVASLASPTPVPAGPGLPPTCPQTGSSATSTSSSSASPASTTAAITTGTTPGAPAGSTPICPPVPTSSATPFTNVFEPGSMSKLVTISAALQSGVVIPSDRFSVPDTLHVADAVFHDAESHPVENWTVTDILANSSNVGTITLAKRLGAQRLADALSAYGFGQFSGSGFPGESVGLVPKQSQWSGTSIGTIAIGQGVAVTAIQMLAAYNAIANGGIYVAPKLVAATVGTDGQTEPTPPSAQRRVVSAQVAAEMTTMLGEVVRVGTGQSAAVTDYSVAGKTGTALVPLANRRGYMTGVYASSFAGFVPAGHPRLTTIVVMDQTPLFGAMASAPVFSTITADGLRDLQIPPGSPLQDAPGVPRATPQTAQAAGESLGPRAATNGSGATAAVGNKPAGTPVGTAGGAASTNPVLRSATGGGAKSASTSASGTGSSATTTVTGPAATAATKPTLTTVPPARR